MSSDNNISAREELKRNIQEELISAIKAELGNSKLVSFTNPEDRESEETILNRFPVIFKLICKIKKSDKLEVRLDYDQRVPIQLVAGMLRLFRSYESQLIEWGKKALAIVRDYIDKGRAQSGIYLKSVTFYLLPQDVNTTKPWFEVPNLLLENLTFGDDGLKKNEILYWQDFLIQSEPLSDSDLCAISKMRK